ncbi:MAG: hypothetical protein GY810_24870 [Aureispira sp.]|nr:hypothetical protein [Aureispira sp.]
MEHNYDIKENPPKLSSEQISKHQNFDDLFAQFEQMGGSSQATSGTEVAIDATTKAAKGWIIKYGIGALVTIAASVVIVFMVGKTFQDGGENGIKGLDNVIALNTPFETLDKPFVTKKVKTKEGATLQYPSGSKVIIPAEAFIDKNGNPITGDVDIEYRELNDHVSMFLAGVPKSLNKHKQLQSSGLVHIQGYQDGEPVYLKNDKKLAIELENTVPNALPTEELKVYAFNTKEDQWQYNTDDQVEVVSVNEPNNSKETTEEREAKALASIKAKHAQPQKPLAPTKPTESLTILDLDIDVVEFPELKKYNDIVWATKEDVDALPSTTNWTNADIKHKSGYNYTFTIVNGDNKMVMNILPIIPYTKKAQEAYSDQLKIYNIALKDWQTTIDSELALWKTEQETNAIADNSTKTIINRFSIDQFGLWNCGNALDASKEAIPANFVTEDGQGIAVQQIFVADKANSLFYSISDETIDNKLEIAYNEDAQQLLWGLTPEGELLVAHTSKHPADGGKNTFIMQPIDVIHNETEVRELLVF